MTTRFRPLILPSLALVLAAGPSGDAPLYSNDFAKAAPGKPADDEFLVLTGEFAVREVDGERVLEVTAAPLETKGVVFGPAAQAPTGAVQARAWAASTGRRVPEFGVGMHDAGGYKLWLMPRQKLVAIRKADETVASAPYDGWRSGTWTHFRLEVAKPAGDGEGCTVRGKVWPAGSAESEGWTVSFDDPATPAPGRASLWAHPYSGQPVRFDDLRVSR